MTQTSGTEGPPHSLVGVRTGTDRDLDPNPSKLDVASSSPAPGTMPPPGRVGVPGQSRYGATAPKAGGELVAPHVDLSERFGASLSDEGPPWAKAPRPGAKAWRAYRFAAG
jgi:hypothetical protein